MSGTLEPRPVTVRDIPQWLRESAGLFARRWPVFVVLSVIYHFLALSAGSFRLFSFLVAVLLCQVTVCICIVAAEASDHGRALGLGRVYAMVRNVLGSLLLLTILYAAIYLAGAAVVIALDLNLPGGDGPGTPLISILAWLSLGNFGFLILYLGLTVSTLWFLTPVVTFNELTLREAALLAKRAESRNEWVVFCVSYVPCFTLAVLAMLSEWTLLLGVLLVPLFGIFQYVAYRHVFLGRKSNNPLPVPGIEAVPILR